MAFTALTVGMSSLLAVDGLHNYATRKLLILEGVSPMLKLWVSIILLMLSSSSFRGSNTKTISKS